MSGDIFQDKRSCGIIYCRKKEATEVIAQRLTDLGIPTLAYHGGTETMCFLSCTHARTSCELYMMFFDR